MSKPIVTTTSDVAGVDWPLPNVTVTQQDRALCSSKPSVHYQLAETPILRNPDARPFREEILQEPEPPQADNLVPENDNVFFPQIEEPDLQLLVPPFRFNMSGDRTLLPEPFSGSPKEDATDG